MKLSRTARINASGELLEGMKPQHPGNQETCSAVVPGIATTPDPMPSALYQTPEKLAILVWLKINAVSGLASERKPNVDKR